MSQRPSKPQLKPNIKANVQLKQRTQFESFADVERKERGQLADLQILQNINIHEKCRSFIIDESEESDNNEYVEVNYNAPTEE